MTDSEVWLPFINGESDFSNSLHELAKAVKTLSLQIPASNAIECRQFKQEQLINVVNGNFSPLEEVNTPPQEFSHGDGMDSLSHLGMISAKRILCDYSEVYEDEFKSLLQLHIEDNTWCKYCTTQEDKKVDLKKGKINSFGCWRRSQDSGHLGFLLRGSVFFANNNVSMKMVKIGASKKLVAQSLGSQQLRFTSVEHQQISPGTSMVCTFLIDMRQDRSSDQALEIEGLLGQQLLHSKNLMLKSSLKEDNYKQRSEKVPAFLSRLIKTTHQKWHLSGPSKHTIGILSVVLINNQNQYAGTSAFTTPMRNICSNQRPRIDFQEYQFSELNQFSKQHLCIDETTLPIGTYMIAFVMDPMIDFGGVAVDQ